MLEPISNKNSISRVTASIYTPQKVLNTKLIFDKIKANPDFSMYQRKGQIHQKNINIDDKGFSINENQNIGFILEEFDKDGKSLNVLKLENTDNNKTFVSFENKVYDNWKNFKERFLSDITNISSELDLYVEAVVLNYIDEFLWKSDEKIDVESIFNSKSDLINQKFLKSYNASLRSVSQSSRIEEKNFEEENTEIFFNNDIKRITISHSFAIKLNKFSLFADTDSENYFDKAHNSNKEVLKSLLTEKVQNQIGLI